MGWMAIVQNAESGMRTPLSRSGKGLNRSRGARVAIAALLAATLVPVLRAGNDPWLGTWEQVLPAPRPFEAPRYKRVTLRIEPWEDGLRVTYDMVRVRGGIEHLEWIGRFDGRDYPVQGVDYVLTNAYQRLGERSYQILLKVDGRPAATATAVVSDDAQTLSVATEQRGAGGETTRSTTVYRRRD
jgi:hypothetical protein